MSCIYFNSPDRETDVEVCGPERAHFGILLNGISIGVLNPRIWRENLLKAIPVDSYLHYAENGYQFERDFSTWFNAGFDASLLIDGKRIGVFDIALNTALAIGNDPIKLAARIHGQCEIHCYVEGKNREWLAGIINQGRELGIYRKNMGWEGVINLLKSTDETPVVLSYSVCEGFPNMGVADYIGDEDDWYDLRDDQQWELAMTGIRKQKGLELKPDGWNDFYFANGINVFDIIEHLQGEEVTE